MTVSRAMLIALMFFAFTFHVCAEEIARSFVLPDTIHELDIEELRPYPVTTICTDAKKTVHLVNWACLALCGAKIAVCYADGSCTEYVTDETGRAVVESADQIMKVAFLGFHGCGERVDYSENHDVLLVFVNSVRPGCIVDVSLFPSDTYEFILEFM